MKPRFELRRHNPIWLLTALLALVAGLILAPGVLLAADTPELTLEYVGLEGSNNDQSVTFKVTNVGKARSAATVDANYARCLSRIEDVQLTVTYTISAVSAPQPPAPAPVRITDVISGTTVSSGTNECFACPFLSST